MVCSVTEGEDKPLKYPLMFRACELVARQQDRPPPPPRLRPRPACSTTSTRSIPTWRGSSERAHRRGHRGVARRGWRGSPTPRGGRCVTEAALGTPIRPTRIDGAARRAHRGQPRVLRATRPSGWPALCHLMAERFARGGRLSRSARSPAARSDARHVAVEFVHPVIVGKRALPAIGLAGEGGELARQVTLLAPPGRHRDRVRRRGGRWRGGAGAAVARERGCLTIAFVARGAPSRSSSRRRSDPYIRQELVETLYHVLWELVHVFFDHRGPAGGPRPSAERHDAGASSFLYPFLDERERRSRAGARRRAPLGADEVEEIGDAARRRR